MTLANFKEAPWSNSHDSYGKGSLAMSPVPEYATSEVVLASLYRVIGLSGSSERSVPSQGNKLQAAIRKAREKTSPRTRGTLDADAFDSLLGSVLESPKRSNQSAKRFLQVMPLVPQVALFSGAPRLAGSPWSPGSLVRRMIWLGSRDAEAASQTWRRLFDALTVGEDDDVFARFLQAEVKAWLPEEEWAFAPADATALPTPPEPGEGAFPARQFVLDLESIIAAKPMLTRRQWTSLLEAVLRLGTVSHVTWLCELHARIWLCISEALGGGGPASAKDASERMFPREFAFLPLSNKPIPGIRDSISRYLSARIGINAVLWSLKGAGVDPGQPFTSPDSLAALCGEVRLHLSGTRASSVRALIDELLDRETRTLLCKKGTGSNIFEFVTYSLQQRQTANPRLRGYDQGYILRKSGSHSSSPWIVSLGPVAVIALVHCSLAGVAGPRSVHRLAQHLAQYGVAMDHRDIPQNELGHQLRLLGLVLDSPDAESGMLLVPPFRRPQLERSGA